MINPMQILRAYMALNQAGEAIKKGPKPGLLSSEWWGMIFTLGIAVLNGSTGLVIPQYTIYGMFGLSALYLIVRTYLKTKHVDLPAIPALENAEVEKFLTVLVQQVSQAPAIAKTSIAETKVQVDAQIKEVQQDGAVLSTPQ